MKVVFYTATCFMDVSVEIINILKHIVELHVIIEITPQTANQTIIAIDDLPSNQVFADVQSLVSPAHYTQLEPYLNGAASAQFLIYGKKGIRSSLKVGYELNKFIRKLNPDILHVEALLVRSAFLLPSIFNFKKLFLSIHDPVPHVGENDLKINLLKSVFLNHPKLKGVFFYSKFAKEQFSNHYKKDKLLRSVIRMYPLTYLKYYAQADSKDVVRQGILFFGRVSPYKGIDVLLSALPAVLNEFPNERLTIAGRSINDYKITVDHKLVPSNTLTVLNKHISNEELVELICRTKLVICPYIEATQSGVLATSFALDTPVIASAVGAFTEYIDDNVNGCLVAPNDAKQLAEKINSLLSNDRYLGLQNNLREENLKEGWANNRAVLFDTYSN